MTVYVLEQYGVYDRYRLGIYATEELAKQDLLGEYQAVCNRVADDDNYEVEMNESGTEFDLIFQGAGMDTWTITEEEVIE